MQIMGSATVTQGNDDVETPPRDGSIVQTEREYEFRGRHVQMMALGNLLRIATAKPSRRCYRFGASLRGRLLYLTGRRS